jgi:hypothetical protein
MAPEMVATQPPEHNVTAIDYSDRRHFRYIGPPLIDVHAHVMLTRADATNPAAPPPDGDLDQAETMLAVAETFGVGRIYTMCPLEHIRPLRQRFGDRLRFNGSIHRQSLDEPEDHIYRRLDEFLSLGVEILEFWSAPRGRERGLYVDAPWRIEAARRPGRRECASSWSTSPIRTSGSASSTPTSPSSAPSRTSTSAFAACSRSSPI